MPKQLLVNENSLYYSTKYKGNLIYASKEDDGSWNVHVGTNVTKTQNINQCLGGIMNSIDNGTLCHR